METASPSDCPDCDVCHKEYDDEIRICRQINPNGIRTPFYEELGDDTIIYPQSYPLINHDQYDLFCLRTRLLPLIKSFSPSYDGNYTTYEEQITRPDGIQVGIMRVYLEIIDGSTTISLTPEQSQALQELADKVVTFNSDYCLLFSAAIYIANEGDMGRNLPDPLAWLSTILLYSVSLPEILEPIYDDGNMYVRLDRKGDYMQEYNYYHHQLLRELAEMYSLGYLPLEEDMPNRQEFIASWSLERLEDGLYAPKWRDTRFASDILAFLEQRRVSNIVSLTLPDNANLVHNIAKALHEHPTFRDLFYLFSALSVSFEISSLEEIVQVMDLVEKAGQFLPEKVVVIPLANKRMEGKVRSTLEDAFPGIHLEAVFYLTDHESPYYLSVSIPKYLDTNTLLEALDL